jgi:hypothetical protein
MNIQNLKNELIEKVKSKNIEDTYDLEQAFMTEVNDLDQLQVDAICETWPTHYEERVELFDKDEDTNRCLCLLAGEILMNEASV